jgi:hypothetical protein
MIGGRTADVKLGPESGTNSGCFSENAIDHAAVCPIIPVVGSEQNGGLLRTHLDEHISPPEFEGLFVPSTREAREKHG